MEKPTPTRCGPTLLGVGDRFGRARIGPLLEQNIVARTAVEIIDPGSAD